MRSAGALSPGGGGAAAPAGQGDGGAGAPTDRGRSTETSAAPYPRPVNRADLLYIIDYGSGNLRSVQKAFEHVDVRVEVGSDPAAIVSAAGLVLPGVGAFGAAMAQLEERGLVEPVLARIEAGVPFLGVCLGLQLLFEGSEEDPGACGLGLVRGDVRALPSRVKVPHIGWNQAEACRDSDLLAGIPDRSAFYFVHSYAVVPRSPAAVLTVTDYGGVSFVSSIEVDNITAVQFHPEKSSSLGLRLYRNFALRAGLGARKVGSDARGLEAGADGTGADGTGAAGAGPEEVW